MGKVEALLEQRELLLKKLRQVSCTLAEAGVDHTEFIQAFLAAQQPQPDNRQEEQGNEECQETLEEKDHVKRQKNGDEESETLELPLKRHWVQVLLYELRGVVLNRESRVIQKIVEERVREGGRFLTRMWIREWLSLNYPQEDSLPSVSWPIWKERLLSLKLKALCFGLKNADWMLRNVGLGMKKRTFEMSATFGKGKPPEDELTFLRAQVLPTGGLDLMQELNAKTVSPKPSSILSLDLLINDSVEGSQELAASVCEFMELVVEPELEQVPGFICVRVGLLQRDVGKLLRINAFFSSSVDECFWVEQCSATVGFMSPSHSLKDWLLMETLPLEYVLVRFKLVCRQLVEAKLFGCKSELRFPSFGVLPNWLNQMYQSFMNASEPGSQIDLVTGKILELLLAGRIVGIHCLRGCSGDRVFLLQQEQQE